MAPVESGLLKKIKKLLALAGSPNPCEAAAALAKAQSLMAEHELTRAEVEVGGLERSDPQVLKSGAEALAAWVHLLLQLVQEVFGVKAIITRSKIRRTNWAAFVGPAGRPEIAGHAFVVLNRQLTRARKEFLASLSPHITRSDRTRLADWYCQGWVSGVRANVASLAVSPEETAALAAWSENNGLQEGKARLRERDEAGDVCFRCGHRDGREVTLRRPVASDPGRSAAPLTIGA